MKGCGTISSDVFLTAKEQVKHCESKGVQFNDFSKTQATKYLEENNNYFKLRAFRKNYVKDKNGKYLHLDFADLVDLAILDNRLRAILLEMTISIEHFSKVHLLKIVQQSESTGSQIVSDYLSQLSAHSKKILNADLEKNKNNIYCGNLYNKYAKSKTQLPIWAFIEIISFGQYLHFYEFCASRTNDPDLNKRLYLLRVVKDLRNACAHNNCLLNDLRYSYDPISPTNPNGFAPNNVIQMALKDLNIPKKSRRKYLYRAVTYQIITTLYAHYTIIPSQGVHNHMSEKLHEFKHRLYRDRTYKNNDIIKGTFTIFTKIIDTWFPIV